jgi:hypothetical protein
MKHFRGHMPVPEDKLRLRYFKMQFLQRPSEDGPKFQDDPLASQRYSVPGSIPISPGGIGTPLAPVGSCIYCGAKESRPGRGDPLGDEHIISRALGGNLLLPEASCEECAGYTSGGESAVLNNLFWVPRHKLKLRPRSTRKREHLNFAFTTMVDGADVELMLPLERHPTILFMPSLLSPGILSVRPPGQSGIHGLWSHWLNDLSLSGEQNVITPALDTVRFCQFIAKIGHSFAVAAVGGALFTPLLPDFIRRRFGRRDEYPECYELVGGHAERHPPGATLHELSLAFTERFGEWFLSAHIRLFANLGAPVYVAVVGKLRHGLTPEQALGHSVFPSAFRAYTPGKSPSGTR